MGSHRLTFFLAQCTCSRAMADTEWQVAGASRRTRRKQSGVVDASPATTPNNLPCTLEGTAATGSSPQLPGWGSQQDSAPNFSYAAANTKRGGRRNQQLRPRTQEEEVDALARQLEELKYEVERSQFYSRLKSAFSKTSHHPLPAAAFEPSVDNVTPEGVTACSGQVQGSSAAAEHQQLCDGWPACIKQLVCWGLGSVQHSRTSRYQLALLLLLRDQLLPGLVAAPELYDPAFTSVDLALMEKLGFSVAADNEHCRRRVREPTFFFLPHLEGHMCDNLLAANTCSNPRENGDGAHAAPSPLACCVLLANSFSTYHHRWEVLGALKGSGKQQLPCCDRPDEAPTHQPKRPDTMLALLAAGAVVEVPIPQEANFPAPSAFNDTSLHLFT